MRTAPATRTTHRQLPDAFAQIASAGAAGCGLEQPIEAMHRALANTTAANAGGFVRPDAALAVITLTDEDDHSASVADFFDQDPSVLGPLSDFRSTHWGVTCEIGGTTPDEMNTPGEKARCTSNESSPTSCTSPTRSRSCTVSRRSRATSLCGDRRRSHAGDGRAATPVGGGPQVPALAYSCSYDTGSSPETAKPPMRIAALAVAAPRRCRIAVPAESSPAVTAIGRSIKNLLGEPCLVRDIAMPADCEVTDDTTGAALSYSLVEDAAACPDGQHLRLDLGQAPTTWARVRCVLP